MDAPGNRGFNGSWKPPWKCIPVRVYTNVEGMLAKVGVTPLLINLENVTVKPMAVGETKGCLKGDLGISLTILCTEITSSWIRLRLRKIPLWEPAYLFVKLPLTMNSFKCELHILTARNVGSKIIDHLLRSTVFIREKTWFSELLSGEN